MRKHLLQNGPERGLVYRDLDGQFVRLVKLTKNLCTWVPVAQGEAARQVTHRDNFVRRFTAIIRSGSDKSEVRSKNLRSRCA